MTPATAESSWRHTPLRKARPNTPPRIKCSWRHTPLRNLT
ncbi:hypothetical protein J500_1394 [Acinetobacter sp. 479375]|nr:hypothetical protein J500_1394 [Acinetobacter sp. 479375]